MSFSIDIKELFLFVSDEREAFKIYYAGKEINDDDPVIDGSISGFAPLGNASHADISLFHDKAYTKDAMSTKARVVLCEDGLEDSLPKDCFIISAKNIYVFYARLLQKLFDETVTNHSIASTVIIEDGAEIESPCIIDDYVVVKKGAKIGKGSIIKSHTVIRENVVIGKDARIDSHVTVQNAVIGDRCIILPGARIGQRGFGFAIDKTPKGVDYVTIPHIGRVMIGDDVEIGANSTIDQGSIDDTIIESGTRIDNLVQIAHNVKLGYGNILAGQVGLAGSTTTGHYVMFGGQSGAVGHLHVGDGAKIMAQSAITKNVEPGSKVMGSPASSYREEFLKQGLLRRMVKERMSKNNVG